MARKPAPKRRPAPDITPDSVPARDESDVVVPDDVRRRDEPDVLPDSVPRPDRGRTLEGRAPIDGGVPEHPVHDEDLEDMGPGDYQRQIDEIEDEALARETDDTTRR